MAKIKSGPRRGPRRKKVAVPSQASAERLAQRIADQCGVFAARYPQLRSRGPRGGAAWTVEVSVVSGPAIRTLNRQYRSRDRVTDVLSFPAPEVFAREGFIGELALGWPVVVRQAREIGHAVARELEVLVVHGFLHLLGLDHEQGASEARRMAVWEKKLLADLRSESPSQGLIERQA